jgi:hypothetical protein
VLFAHLGAFYGQLLSFERTMRKHLNIAVLFCAALLLLAMPALTRADSASGKDMFDAFSPGDSTTTFPVSHRINGSEGAIFFHDESADHWRGDHDRSWDFKGPWNVMPSGSHDPVSSDPLAVDPDDTSPSSGGSTGASSTVSTPEPALLFLLATGLLVSAVPFALRRASRESALMA